ncbi:hypothetical protein BU15DRAFT_74337 [Melanogaster broomeanus]|nr:hypothetical protein BU15DRAFT_74337 [Melanogaster broomeanus]
MGPTLRASATSQDASDDGGGPAARVYLPTSTRKFTFPNPRPSTLTPIAGRWIVICNRTGIYCVDLEAEEVPLESTTGDYVVRPVELYKCVGAKMELSSCVSTVDAQGHVVAYVVAEERAHLDDEEHLGPKSISVVKLTLPFETGREQRHHMSATCTGRFSIGEATLFNAVLAYELLVIHVVDLGHPHRFWLSHTSTDKLYQIIGAEPVDEEEPPWVSLHLCSTHIMMVHRRYQAVTRTWECYVEGYPHPTLPPPSTDPSTSDNNNIPVIHLQLSHMGVCPVSMVFSGVTLWEHERHGATAGQPQNKGQGTRVVLIAYRTPPLPRIAVADLVLEPPPLSSSHPSSYTTATNSRSEPAAITCTLHDIFVPLDTDLRYGLLPRFHTTSCGTESRGIIESGSSGGDLEKRDTFGFTLSLEVLSDLTAGPGTGMDTETQGSEGNLEWYQSTSMGMMKVSFWLEKLTLPAATTPCVVIGFDGNTGRVFRRHQSEGKVTMEIIDFA